MSDAYSERTLDHFNNPRNVGTLSDASVVGHAENPASGTSIELHLGLSKGAIIERASFRAHGCAATIAAGSVATELIIGRRLTATPVLTREDLVDALDGLPPARRHAYRLVTDAIQSASDQYSSSIAESA
ncbi:MAG: iron-sulfur cluster assembly scaffold protein [Candidatus Latescibacterota bacterium]|nr:iron-sulfur cluster assembly scaffold protein [Candidatus Latescibacterota bacterium]